VHHEPANRLSATFDELQGSPDPKAVSFSTLTRRKKDQGHRRYQTIALSCRMAGSACTTSTGDRLFVWKHEGIHCCDVHPWKVLLPQLLGGKIHGVKVSFLSEASRSNGRREDPVRHIRRLRAARCSGFTLMIDTASVSTFLTLIST